jgi:serine/threonine protein kinase/formylglycine-generating enzyme required for sulfatase activity
MTPDPGEDEFFTAFLAAVERGDDSAIDGFFARHPEHASQLKRLREQVLETRSHEFSKPSHAEGAPSSWDHFLAKLRDLGSNSRRYEERGPIGKGGIGLVLEVFDTVARRSLAMKVLREQREKRTDGSLPPIDDRQLGRFIEEAQITGQLDHPGIVPVHEVGVDDKGHVYFTMKRVRGSNLHDVFEKVKAGVDGWNIARALSVLQRVCEAMAYAHAKGVIHRDLKPGNVMVGSFGEVFVMDWGLARLLDTSASPSILDGDASSPRVSSDRRSRAAESPDTPLATLDGEVIGTPVYMPPEQARGNVEQIGRHSDIYSVGAMLYELLAGRPPFADAVLGKSLHATLARILAAPPTPLVELAPEAAPELLAICNKAMARAIADRFDSMEALASDLRAFLENRVVTAYRTGALEELKRWVARNRALATTAFFGIIAVLGFSVWALVERNNAREEANRADRSAEEAIAKSQSLLRLSDSRRLERLVERESQLRSPFPAAILGLSQWLREFDEIAARLPYHEETRRQLLERTRLEEAQSGSSLLSDSARDETAWWFDAVRKLVDQIEDMRRDDPYSVTRKAIEVRLVRARAIESETVMKAAGAWQEAATTIADETRCPHYHGLKIVPQVGLIPLGVDPESKLYEFMVWDSGEPPTRDSATGRIRIDERMGIVLVLLPGGSFQQGSQRTDPNAPNYDALAGADETGEGVVVSVALDPFFLSKYEITRAQWTRLVGRDPSFFAAKYPETSLFTHPAESLSWRETMDALPLLGLALPTEAQWEYACRAGSTTPWPFGLDQTQAARFANVKDQSFRRSLANIQDAECEPFDDGVGLLAEVGHYAPNTFGLHDTIGNVLEWCRDSFGNYDVPAREGDGMRFQQAFDSYIARGGAWNLDCRNGRSAWRFAAPADFMSYSTGVRPARPLTLE